jgi:alginate O-acetyltransferase complex protein AlgI
MFFNRSLSDFGALVGYHWPAALVSLTILLPIGISFYSFHAISYALDIYYGKVKPARSLLEFAVYITMFPQLIAGPIVRYSDVVNQLNRPLYSGARIYAGFQFFILGLAKKVLIADFASTLVDSFFAQGPAHFPPLHVAVAVLAYSVQIYFDFSGYSDMAIGLGYFIGFQLPINFNSPYKAVSFSDFWRRWHISLSTFLRDYLYFSLGGNRGSTLSTYRNLFLTMLLGGLWHGASWNFVIWGGAHGLLLAVERLLGDRNPIHRLPTSLQVACTFLCVSLIWVFFRAPNLPSSLAVFKALFVPHQATEAIFVTGAAVRAGVITAFGLLLAFGVKNTNQISQTPSVLRTATLATLFVVSIVALFMSQEHPFLYFQF